MRKLRLRQVKSLAPVYTANETNEGSYRALRSRRPLGQHSFMLMLEAFRDTGLWEILPSVGCHVRASEGGQQSNHSLTGEYPGRKDQNLKPLLHI